MAINETPQSRKTTGTNNAPSPQVTVGPTNSDTEHPYAIGGQDVTGYVGVDPAYRTYGDTKFKPLPVSQGMEGEEVSEETEHVSAPRKAAAKKAAAKAAR